MSDANTLSASLFYANAINTFMALQFAYSKHLTNERAKRLLFDRVNVKQTHTSLRTGNEFLPLLRSPFFFTIEIYFVEGQLILAS